ncbi:MAG: aldo/keto reductase [Patescibacteria group bacterium]|nr:aldo/keto reductase [Patescibacteria group bacterium]
MLHDLAGKKYINGKNVHPIGIGTWGMGSGIYPDKTHYAVYGNEDQEIEAIRYSLARGQNHIDTAQIYGIGHTEEIVGQAIQGFDRSRLFIASKLWKSHLKGDAILYAIEGMLTRLQTSYLDLVYLHGYWEDYEPVQQQLKGLEKAKNKGLIHGIGVSNFTLDQLQRAHTITQIVAIQNYYSIANRSWASKDLLAFCQQESIAFVAAKPLDRGALLTENFFKPFCEKYKKSPSQIALAWLINQEPVCAIPKAVCPVHIDENLQSLFEVSSDDMMKLDTLRI